MPAKDPYKILGISKTASQEEIKNAYRNLAKQYHPDLNLGNKDAESKFKDISHAYQLLSSPQDRARYDRGEFEEAPSDPKERGPFYYRTQQGGSSGSGRYSFGFENFGDDFFESIFGRRARREQKRGFQFPGEDQIYQMEISLRDAVLGAQREVTLSNGKKLSVKIPQGVTDGVRLKFAGQGSPGVGGGSPGDAYIELRIRTDERFQRKGDDLILELPVSITEAVFGGEVQTPTIDGHVVLKIPRHSNTDTRLKLTGKGAYNRTTKRRGDQIVILKVMLPEPIDSDLERALHDWKVKHSYDPRERRAV